MKFGVYLEQNMAPGWEEYYHRYKPLKIQLKEIVALNEELATKSAEEKADLADKFYQETELRLKQAEKTMKQVTGY